MLLSTEKSHDWRIIKGFVCSFKWMNEEPAMFIWPAPNSIAHVNNSPIVIPIDCAQNFVFYDNNDKSNGYPDVPYCTKFVMRWLHAIGAELDKSVIRTVIDIIIDGIPDLLKMPPEPMGMSKAQLQEVGEATIKVDGETIKTLELTAPEGL